MKLALVIAIFAMPLMAQNKPSPEPPPTGPQLSVSEVVALKATVENIQHLQQQIQQEYQTAQKIEAEIAHEHPGYHLDEKTLTVVKDAPAPNPPAKK